MGQIRQTAVAALRFAPWRRFAAFLALSLPLSSFSFDAEAWHGKRELFAREAERLQVAYSNCLARLETPAEDVTVPVETFDDGSVKVLVTAKRAQYFLDSGLVWAEGVVVRRFREDASCEARIEAERCVIDRVAKSGWAEGAATLVHGKTVFRGRGIYFSSPEAYVRVQSEAEIVSEDLSLGGLRP